MRSVLATLRGAGVVVDDVVFRGLPIGRTEMRSDK